MKRDDERRRRPAGAIAIAARPAPRRSSFRPLGWRLGLLGCCLWLVAAPLLSPPLRADERPNILWLSCEDISPHLGCYGDPDATTPHLDGLARQGVRYTHAFVTAGVCAPCRSTIITGMYQTTLGTHHMRCTARLPEHIKPFPIYLRQAGYYCTNNSKKDYQFRDPAGTWDQSSGKAHWRNRPDPDQPFFSVFNFTECHESGIADTGKYQRVTRGIERHDPASLDSFPPYYPDTPAARADWGRYYDVITAMDRRVGQLLKQLNEDGLAEDTIVIFWSDHGAGLPRAKRWLYDSGMHVPLIVRIPDKWRSWRPGAPGATSDRLVSLMDLGPTVLRLAGVSVPDHVQGKPFLGPDLPAPREYVFGARDRMDERYDIIRAVRDHRYKYIRNYEPFKTYYQYMNTPEKGRLMREIRRVADQGALPTAAARYLAPSKPDEELYDTQSDPHEIHNLADNPQYADVLRRMRAVHQKWVLETRDLGLIPEPLIARRETRLGSAFAILREPGAEDLIRRVRDAAALTRDGKAAGDAMLQATLDADSAVRYWGAVGLGNLAKDAPPEATARMRELLADKSAVVRVAAARALCRMGQAEPALPVLCQVLDEGQQWERLHAVIVLDEIDELARPVMAQLQQALQYRDDLVQQGKYTVRVANRALNELLGTNRAVR